MQRERKKERRGVMTEMQKAHRAKSFEQPGIELDPFYPQGSTMVSLFIAGAGYSVGRNHRLTTMEPDVSLKELSFCESACRV